MPKIPFRAIPQLIFVEWKQLFHWVFYSSKSSESSCFAWLASWVLTNCEPASQRVMRVEPVSHASHASHHVSHARQKFERTRIHFLANHKQFNFFNICSMKLAFRRQQESFFYSPSIFLASSQTAPCPLSSFDTHARCSPKRKVLDLDDLTEK